MLEIPAVKEAVAGASPPAQPEPRAVYQALEHRGVMSAVGAVADVSLAQLVDALSDESVFKTLDPVKRPTDVYTSMYINAGKVLEKEQMNDAKNDETKLIEKSNGLRKMDDA